jgi:hypothetical protein
MAQKKITDLQLRDNVEADLNFPSDDGIQSYRVTATQIKNFVLANQNVLLAMLKDDIFTGLTAVTPADDDYFPLVDTNDSNKTKKALVGSFVRTAYRAINSTNSLTTGDGTAKLSGASFTLTLPTAVGVEGKRYKILHAGTSLSQVYTLATTSSQTIGGIASAAYKLCTNGEVLEIESDGANWIILNHKTETGLLAYTPTFGAGFGTVSTHSVLWKREGDKMRIQGNFTLGTASGNIGTITLPSGAVLDTAKLGLNNNSGNIGNIVGDYWAASVHSGALITAPATATNLIYWGANQTGSNYNTPAASVSASILASSAICCFNLEVPIADWQP